MTINRKDRPCDIGDNCYVQIGAGLEGNMKPVDLIDKVSDLVAESSVEGDCDALTNGWLLSFDLGLQELFLRRHFMPSLFPKCSEVGLKDSSM